jgi:hypothetical protein
VEEQSWSEVLVYLRTVYHILSAFSSNMLFARSGKNKSIKRFFPMGTGFDEDFRWLIGKMMWRVRL